MHRIDLRVGTGLFVLCPSCKSQIRISGSKHTRVIMAFNSAVQKLEGVCAACKAPLVWTPQNANVAPL
jgi:hypothetical protein